MRPGPVLGVTVAALVLTACGAGPVQPPAALTTSSPVTTTTRERTTGVTSSVPTSAGPTPAVPDRTVDTAATVTVYGADVDSPGAAIPLVATAHGTADDERVQFHMALDGTPGSCEGPQWRHPTGVSQTCWVTLPRRRGSGPVTAYATLTSSRGTARTAPGAYAVRFEGPTTEPVTGADRERTTACAGEGGRVMLTFDDGFPSTAAMHAVLDVLRETKVKGRFFATGNWARTQPGMVAAIRAEGHLIENHSSTHAWLNRLEGTALDREIAGGPAADSPKLLRPGYGAGSFSRRVHDAAKTHGLGVCFWTVDPRDWAGPSADTIVQRIMHGDEKTAPVAAGGVVLLHMTGRHTAAALPRVIAEIRSRGLVLDPL